MSKTSDGWERLADGAVVGSWWQPASKPGRLDCLLCPRQCSLAEGDRGFCFVREHRDGKVVLSTYGRSTGFCIDPIEKKPLNHFYPGSAVLSFGTAGCNLGCRFCQNWDISKSREIQRLSQLAEPETIAVAAKRTGCTSVAFTYNDPVIWAEYAIDTARQCRQQAVKTVAVTAGYISPGAREEFFQWMDAANVDLKGFTEEFYSKITYSHLQPVLDTLRYLVQETNVWVELTNLLIPDLNDNPDDLRRMCDWILSDLGDRVPIHFTAFHPDFRMLDRQRTDPETLLVAYDIAQRAGLKFVYVGNVHDHRHQTTYCQNCSAVLIERDWYELGRYDLRIVGDDGQAECPHCGTLLPGHFTAQKGTWGSQRQPIRIDQFASQSNPSPNCHAVTPKLDVRHAHITLPNITKPSFSSPLEEAVTSAQSTQTDQSNAASDAAQFLKLDRVSAAERTTCLHLAASAIATSITGQPIKTAPETVGALAQAMVMGAFVTLKRGHLLRGCCGVLGRPTTLGSAVSSAAMRTAREDHRMAPISACELPFLTLEVTLLGPMQQIVAAGSDRAAAVRIGRHGLMIQRGDRSGLLLPSVATERGWNATEFLRAVCTKAQLPTDAWQKEDAQVMTFDGASMSQQLAELLPNDLPKSTPAPLSRDQLDGYAQIAAQNIHALAVGGTPSYVAPHLPDLAVSALVLSLEWAPMDDTGELATGRTEQGSAIQVSFRPGLPLQSSLFQMCQQATNMLAQQRFTGQLNIGLTLGFDPALHGHAESPDLQGVDTGSRAIIVSDQRHCGIAFNPDQSSQQLLEQLRGAMPVGCGYGWVHSVQVLSTLPHLFSISAPSPTPAVGIRAPAVAGTFYPAEDAARRAMIDALIRSGKSPIVQPDSQSVLAAMVPHAGLKFSGSIASEVWKSLQVTPDRTLIIISPKHSADGVNWAVCPQTAWGLSSTTSIAGAPELAQQIAQHVDGFQLDAAAHASEHGIEVQLPILERLEPGARVVGIAMHGGSWQEIQAAAAQMSRLLSSLENPPLMIISSDLNHFADEMENRRRDLLALEALATGDPQRLLEVCQQNEISMCGLIPAAFVMETLRQLGHHVRCQQLSYATSADVTGDKSRVVGYAGVILTSSSAGAA